MLTILNDYVAKGMEKNLVRATKSLYKETYPSLELMKAYRKL
jgi:hypothetical protein